MSLTENLYSFNGSYHECTFYIGYLCKPYEDSWSCLQDARYPKFLAIVETQL